MYLTERIELLEPSNNEVLSGLTIYISYYFYILFILYHIQIRKSLTKSIYKYISASLNRIWMADMT